MMGGKSCCWFVFFLFIFSSFVAQSHGMIRKQTELLNLLRKAKMQGNSGIDTSLFEVNEIESETESYKILPQKGMKEKDRIERLPGQPHVGFSQYGGYVTIDESKGEALYYYFVEAPTSKEYLPLLLWLNGGPGCSSLGAGAMAELGPFRVHSDGKTLYRNRFAWNKAANVLFLETPSGVGFSYSNISYNYRGDRKTAGGNYAFLVNWLERFPEYKKRDFYIAGESYAGHFVPQLAHVILHHNKKANRTIINLKGITIGNAAIHDETDWLGMYQYFGSHALVSPRTTRQIEKHCDFSPGVTNQTKECNTAFEEVYPNIANIDIYNIYGPVCLDSNLTAKPKKVTPVQFDPCSYDYVHAYLNRPDVQEALHANVTKLKYDWEICNNVVYNWTDSAWSIITLLHEFMENGLRVWVYSGDVDGRVPVTSTLASLAKMRLTVKTPWHPWFLHGEVGGYTEVYKGDLTFATVRGAGHQVPSFQPRRALSLIIHFLAGTPLPN
ncbi:hypothetical protein PVL29_017567 [Vitis rotundifolia]|uniref:Carboxypeptidase n=1 Tax=Vitis rotundifolia TaxID=103349 RepID=A0AA38ZB39_VITRO|nr:hypothetical protein PVL29_017567 [Vitis rotundifolia]